MLEKGRRMVPLGMTRMEDELASKKVKSFLFSQHAPHPTLRKALVTIIRVVIITLLTIFFPHSIIIEIW